MRWVATIWCLLSEIMCLLIVLEVLEKELIYLWSKAGVLHGAISHLLLVLASHGPALDTKTRGLQIAAQGKVVCVLLAKTVDGVSVKRVLGFEQ